MPSSVIARYHYNVDTKSLVITFVSGSVYEYMDVPEDVYHNMKAVTSKGKFFNDHIKDHFTFTQIR